MDSIRIRNLRSLVDTGDIPLTPITVLVGRNSSGKSTFLRALPLLRQSAESKKAGPVLWYGRYVDFGAFGEAIRADSIAGGRIWFDFSIRVGAPERRDHRLLRHHAFLREKDVTVSLSLADDSGRTRADSIQLQVHHSSTECDHINLEFDDDGKVLKCIVNSQDLSAHFAGARQDTRDRTVILPQIAQPEPDPESLIVVWADSPTRPSRALLAAGDIAGGEWFHNRTKPGTRIGILGSVAFDSADMMLQELRGIAQRRDKALSKRLGGISRADPVFVSVRNHLLAHRLPRMIRECDLELASIASGIMYLAPVRATAQRFYRSQELAVDEIDHRGENVAMFLQNLGKARLASLSEFGQQTLGFSVRPESHAGHVSIRLSESRDGRGFNLADMGFGFSQVLPILAQVWSAIHQRPDGVSPLGRYGRILAIEQPELHLHPHYDGALRN